MATDPLAFDTDKCPIDPVTRIPPCEQMLHDPRIADAPQDIPDCTGTDLTLPVEPPSASVEVTEASINMLPAGATPTIDFVATQLDCGRTGLTLDIGVPEGSGGGNSESGGGGGGGGGGCPTVTADASAEVGDSDAPDPATVVVSGTPCAPHFDFTFVVPPSSFSGSMTVFQTEIIDGQTVILSSEITISGGSISQTPYVFYANTGDGPCTTGSGIAALTRTKCLTAQVVSASGKCFGFTGAIVALSSTYGSLWVSADSLGDGGIVTFDRVDPVPIATIDGVEGIYLGADCGGLLYEFGVDLCGISISSSESDSTIADCNDVFVVRFACACCSIPGWDGEGWYCIRAAGTDDACEAHLLTDEDRCDKSIEICSGPYEDGAAAGSACPITANGGPDCTTATNIELDTTYVWSHVGAVGSSGFFVVATEPFNTYRFVFEGDSANFFAYDLFDCGTLGAPWFSGGVGAPVFPGCVDHFTNALNMLFTFGPGGFFTTIKFRVEKASC